MKISLPKIALVAGFALALAPFTTWAQTGTFSFTTVGGTGTGYTWDGMMILTINNGADVEITGTATGGRRIEVAKNATAKITLKNLSITGLNSGQSPILLNSGAKLTVKLVGENVLTGGSNRAGIEAPDGTTLEISGEGSLKSTGGTECAGIGGNSTVGKITISGGSVTADGGFYGAGIGGCNGIAGGIIIITGGTVTANSNGGAGIGGGYEGDGGKITISGGTVTAYGNSGIGGGHKGAGGETIINGGTVTATGYSGAGIGGGSYGSNGGKITISGGVVIATSEGNDSYGAGIGGGYRGNGGEITISGGTVTAKGGSSGGAGIGGGYGGITISGGTVIAESGGSFSTSIGGGSSSKITISGGTVTANARSGVGIGGSGAGVKITISGGTVTANCDSGSCTAIGSDDNGKSGTIIISGGIVTANCSASILSGAGIGGTLIMNNDNGGALVFASSISDMSSKTSGVLVVGNTTYWFGGNEFILTQNAVVPNNYTLTILSGKTFTVKQNVTLTIANNATLAIPAGTTLTNNGTIIPANSSTINVEGTVKGNKITGSNVTTPKLSGKTTTNITLNASTFLATTGQTTVEYAINTIDSPPTNGWQTSTTFNDLKPDTDYYLFSRSAGNANFTEGSPLKVSNYSPCPEEVINNDSDYCVYSFNKCFEIGKTVTLSTCDMLNGTVYLGGGGGSLLVRTDGSTPILLPQIASSNIIAKAIGNNIVLENLPTNAKVELYNLQGKRIYSSIPENPRILRILVQTKGIYVIKAGPQTMRIAVK